MDHIRTTIDGQLVPTPKEVRTLEQLITHGLGNKSMFDKLATVTSQVNGMLRRITNKTHRLEEKEAT